MLLSNHPCRVGDSRNVVFNEVVGEPFVVVGMCNRGPITLISGYSGCRSRILYKVALSKNLDADVRGFEKNGAAMVMLKSLSVKRRKIWGSYCHFAYTDAGYLTDADNLKSQTGYVFVLNGGSVDWKSTKQSIFATSSTDVEYIAAFDASKEAVWIRKFISGLGIVPIIEEPISMYCDNTRAIAIAKDDGVTKGARHFRAKVHYLRETIKMGDVKIEMIDTNDNLADPFCKT
ncbi:hypothetical protein Tco_1358845 [Tanacetum coccineum]